MVLVSAYPRRRSKNQLDAERHGFMSMSRDAELFRPESIGATSARWNLQSKWWKTLTAHPDAILHQHIKPGKLLMLGADSDDEKCSIAAGLSLNYFVWPDRCEVSLDIGDGSEHEDGGEVRRRSDWEKNAFKILLTNKDQIEASFGDALDWCETGSVNSYVDGGYMNPEQEWDAIITQQVRSMNRLHTAILPHVEVIPILKMQ